MKIAIIGSGISGLSSALLLSQDHDITLFESNDRFGGHANTVTVSENKKLIPVDTGFIVYNELNYPNLVGLFNWLNVPTIKSEMSFAVSARNGQLEYSGSIKGLFAQKRNFFNLGFYKILRDIFIFFTFGYKYAFNFKGNETLKEYIKRCNFSDEFVYDHLLPMSSAIWSCPEKEILNFPAKSLLSFFKNHQLINFVVRPKWRTVKGGSLEYIKKIINYLEKNRNNKLLLKSKIKLISSKNKKINISFNNNENLSFDKVIMATHPDQTIKLIKDLNKKSYEIINKFKYQRNIVYLHSDKSLMPKNKKIWSSWNYLSNNNNQSSVTYWMNILQNLPIKKEVFVSLNPFLVPQKILTYKKIYYDHPIFNNDTDEAQKEMITIQGKDNIYYTGAWTGYGFHEDGIKSAVDVARSLNVKIPWDNDTKK